MKTLILILLFIFSFEVSQAQLAIFGETVYTVSGEPLKNGYVLISNGLIEQVTTTMPDTTKYSLHRFKVVTPGLIDAHSVVGLAGMLNYNHDQDQLEKSDPIQPELRAIDAYNPNEGLIKYLRENGITTIHTGHAPGALMSGQSLIAKTTGETVPDAVVQSPVMVTMTLGPNVSRNFKKPGTRAKAAAMIREVLTTADQYRQKRNDRDESKRPPKDLKMEILADLLDGKVMALVTAQQAPEILTALRIQKEFGFKMVLDGAAEAYLVKEDIKDAGVPVLIHPTMVRNYGDTRNAAFTTAAKLIEAGITVAFQGGYESYVPKTRVVLWEAAVAVANGLSFRDGLRSLTLTSAEILGIDERVGSIEKGKQADIVGFNGDPFEYMTSVELVVINGKVEYRKH